MPSIFNQAIFEKDFPLEGVHLVAASAGTGKTYNIQNIYARLIMERGLRVSEIQVMTFTEAATAELRDRLRTMLKDLQTRLSPNPHDCDGKDETERASRNERADKLIQCADDRSYARNQVELALLEFDNATISTIHGFCSRALNRYAFETRMGFHPDIQDNKTETLLKMAQDWWRANRNAFPEDLKQSLKFGEFSTIITELAKKTDWALEEPDANTPEGFLLQHAQEIVKQYEEDRVNREKQTFDDILRAMREALQSETTGLLFAQRLREECKAALIDEFQDTDPVQYEIVQRAFLADKNFPVFFVGDPKQAIYSFRGGDIFTYKKAKNDIPSDATYYLDTNYRTTPKLMDAINDIFLDRRGSDGEPIFTFGDESISYSDRINSNGPAPLSALPPFRFIQTQHDMDALVYEIQRTLREFPELTLKDIAVLTRGNEKASGVMCHLRENGIPCVIKQAGNVFTSGSFNNPYRSLFSEQLYSLLRAIDSNGNEKQVRTALLTPFFGFTPSELLLMQETELADWIGNFQELHSLWYTRGFAAMLNRMETLGTRNGVTLRQRIASLPNGERVLTDYQQILELAFKTIKEQGTAPKTLLHWLKNRLTSFEEEKDSDELTRELESEGDTVKIMTIHKAKGLEFPVVLLPECNIAPYGKQLLNTYHDPNHDYKLTFTFNDNPLATKETLEELTRMLYVAMTRATQRTVVFYEEPKMKEILSRLVSNAKEVQGDDAIQWETWEPDEDTPPNATNVRPAEPETLEQAEKPFKFSSDPSRGSYSALSPGTHDNASDDARDTDSYVGWKGRNATSAKEPIFRIQGGTAIGSCWHDILEEISFQDTDEEILSVAKRVLEVYGFDPNRVVSEDDPATMADATVGMIHKTLDHQLLSPDGMPFSLREVQWENRLSEQEFNFATCNAQSNTGSIRDLLQRHWRNDESKRPFLSAMNHWEKPIPNGFLNGFIDLIFRHQGFYYIVDWKSNLLGGSRTSFTNEGLRTEMASAGYFFQYLLYATVLHRFLRETLGSEYDYERNFGGIRYYFLRGLAVDAEAAVFSDRPKESLLDEIAAVLNMGGNK